VGGSDAVNVITIDYGVSELAEGCSCLYQLIKVSIVESVWTTNNLLVPLIGTCSNCGPSMDMNLEPGTISC
jgi:hypothetical protein